MPLPNKSATRPPVDIPPAPSSPATIAITLADPQPVRVVALELSFGNVFTLVAKVWFASVLFAGFLWFIYLLFSSAFTSLLRH